MVDTIDLIWILKCCVDRKNYKEKRQAQGMQAPATPTWSPISPGFAARHSPGGAKEGKAIFQGWWQTNFQVLKTARFL